MGLWTWLFNVGRKSRDGFLNEATHQSKAVLQQYVSLPGGRFGRGRHKPPGEWVQTSLLSSVAGVQHRKGSVEDFARAVILAEQRGATYGVELQPNPSNVHDTNAIEVHGKVAGQRWHIGFLDRDTAADISSNLIAKGIPIAGELYAIWVGDQGFIDVKIFVLAPPGYSHSKRRRTR